MICYSCRSVAEQMQRGKWDFHIESVYSICFTNFILPGDDRRLVLDRAYCDLETRQPVSDRQRYLYIQLPVFDKVSTEDCETELQRWIYSLKNMPEMREIPFAARDEAFSRLQQVGEIESLTPEERREYERDQKQLSILHSIETSRYREGMNAGRAEGRAEELRAIVLTLRKSGMIDTAIAALLQKPLEQIISIV